MAVVSDRLRVEAPAITPEIRETLARFKPALLAILNDLGEPGSCEHVHDDPELGTSWSAANAGNGSSKRRSCSFTAARAEATHGK